MKKRYVELSSAEELLLKQIKKTSNSERERDRAQALLLSNKGQSIEELSSIFEVRRATITYWLNRWNNGGIQGLSDHSKSGRPPIFNESEQKK